MFILFDVAKMTPASKLTVPKRTKILARGFTRTARTIFANGRRLGRDFVNELGLLRISENRSKILKIKFCNSVVKCFGVVGMIQWFHIRVRLVSDC